MTDHLELAPEMIESMKRDLVDVIGRYVEVDRDKIEVNFERQDRALAMLANIPIISVNRPSGNGNGNGAHVTLEPAPQVHVAPEPVAQEPPKPPKTPQDPQAPYRAQTAQARTQNLRPPRTGDAGPGELTLRSASHGGFSAGGQRYDGSYVTLTGRSAVVRSRSRRSV